MRIQNFKRLLENDCSENNYIMHKHISNCCLEVLHPNFWGKVFQ
jgi:hypothetical protein